MSSVFPLLASCAGAALIAAMAGAAGRLYDINWFSQANDHPPKNNAIIAT